MHRRTFAASLLAAPLLAQPPAITQALSQFKVPAVTAVVASPSKLLYSGAIGVPLQAIFSVASLTKAITTLATLQLVEQGKLSLDEPVENHFPELAQIPVLESLTVLRPAQIKITLRHLLTHTSGLAYTTWDPLLAKYRQSKPAPTGLLPLRFDPGTGWTYGTSVDWAGRLVETISGLNLEEYFQRHIFTPLDMKDTSFVLTRAKFPRFVTNQRRQPSGLLRPDPRRPVPPAQVFTGGGGLYSTAPDYAKFLQFILDPKPSSILQPDTVRLMTANQIGALDVPELPTSYPNVTANLRLNPDPQARDKFTFGFLLNPVAYPGGRSADSLAWAGSNNAYFWIDPARQLCAVLLMQFQPFLDPAAVSTLRAFENAVYRSFPK